MPTRENASLKLKNIIVAFLLVFLSKLSFANQDCVILLHGLARTSHSMAKLATVLQKNNYTVINHTYPSTQKSITQLANSVIQPRVNQCLLSHPKHIHFVTHSLGGLILQKYLQTHGVAELSTIVMMSPPNHGSRLADLLHNNTLAQRILGPAFAELTTQKKPTTLSPGTYKIGIIAGNYDFTPFGKKVFNEPNDGVVPVSSTVMEEMADFIVLPVSHTFMMRNQQVINQILCFLKSNHFCKTW